MAHKTIKSMKAKKIILTLLILGLIGAFVAYKIYNKPHVDVAETSSDISLKATKIVDDFSSDENAANKKYLDKIVEVSGSISSIKTENETVIIALEGNDFGNVLCYLSEESRTEINSLKEGQQIKLKGICTGFLLDVVLVKSVITNQNKSK